MTASNVDHANLDAQAYGGIVSESVMAKIWDVSRIPLVVQDLVGTGTHDNRRVEFTVDDLGVPATDNAVIDGADIDQNDAVLTERQSNFTQTAVKEIQISHLAQAGNSFGGAGKMSYQIMQAQRRLKRDIEAQICTSQASVIGDGTATPGISAGLGAWISTNYFNAGTTGDGAAGGFNTTTGVIDAPTADTTPAALTEKLIRDAVQAVFEAGGGENQDLVLMATPQVIRNLSEFLFTTNARIATMTSDNNQGGTSPMTAYGSTNVFIPDFGVLKMVANRLQPTEATNVSTAYILDPSHIRLSYMRGPRVEPLAKTGLSEKRLCSADYSLLVMNEKSCAQIANIDETAAVTAT